MNIRSLILYVIAFAAICSACNKPSDLPADPNNPSSHLSAFTATVVERIPTVAIISWTASQNLVGTDIVQYKVLLDGHVIHTGLNQLRDTLIDLLGANTYAGKVVAYTAAGDSTTADFSLPPINGFAIFGRNDGTTMKNVVEAYDVFSGVRLWHTVTGTENSSLFTMPTISHDTVFICKSNTYDFSVYALNCKTGALLWKAVPSTGSNGISAVCYFQGRLYATLNGKVICLNASNGQLLWTYQNATSNFDSYATAVNGKVYVGTYNGGGSDIYALNATDGSVAWHYQYIGSYAGRPLVNNGTVYFCTSTSMYALNESSGAVVWSRPADANFQCGSSPVLYNNTLITSGGDPGIFALNPATGATVWNYANGVSTGSPSYGNGNIYFGQDYSSTYKLTCINASTGTELWQVPGITSWATVFANNRVYVFGPFLDRIHIRDATNGSFIDEIGDPFNHYYNDTGSFALYINDLPYYHPEHPNYKL